MRTIIGTGLLLLLGACATTPESDEVQTIQSELSAGRVGVCHVASDHTVSIVVSANAVDAHLAHGDRLANDDGTCDESPCFGAPDNTMMCEGTGFLTCVGGAAVYRDCAAGTACVASGDGIVCDWPQ